MADGKEASSKGWKNSKKAITRDKKNDGEIAVEVEINDYSCLGC